MATVIEQMRASAPGNLALMVKTALQFHLGRGQRISKEALSLALLKKYTSTTDRQIRDAVAQLQEEGELIVTDSEDGGYFYAETPADVERYLADIQSRMQKLTMKRDAMLRAMWAKFRAVPHGAQMNLL